MHSFELYYTSSIVTVITSVLWYIPAYIIFLLMINAMKTQQNYMYGLQKKELMSFAFGLLLTSIAEIISNIISNHYSCVNDPDTEKCL
jgi:uncharacterized metal-binding protein